MTERRSFFAELKRRNVYKVAVAYAIVGWLIVQIATQVFPFLEIPNWVVRLVIILVAIGFPMALIIAWAFELTPEGIKRTGDVDRSARDASTNRIWVYVAVIGAALAVGLFFVGRYTAGNTTPGHDASPARTEATTASAQKSIAVLPLLNESGDPKDEYFSDGLSEELIAALAQIRDLKVIGRSSSFRFKDRKEEPKTIGEKLGVATLLEGTVRKQGDRVRIVAELINAADGIELWTRTFDRELKDIFAVQQEIAAAVADSLKVTLLGSEERSAQKLRPIMPKHTTLIFRRIFISSGAISKIIAKLSASIDQAIQLDPQLCPGLCRAFRSLDLDRRSKRPAARRRGPKARSDAEKAVAIAPALAEAHAALGWVRCFVRVEISRRRLRELRRAKELSPANPTANDLLARVIVYLGRVEEAERKPDRRWNLILCLISAKQSRSRSLAMTENWMRRTRLRAKQQSCSRPLLPVIAGRSWSQSNAATAKRHCAKRSWNRTELIAASNLRLRIMRVEIVTAADAALADLIANDREGLDYQIAEVYACAR